MLVVDPKVTSWVDEDREYWHASAGAMIFNEKDELLLFKRLLHPFVYSIPAGHIEPREDPEDAVVREVAEEVGIADLTPRLVLREDIVGDECRRGADNHRWHLYCGRVNSAHPLCMNDEGTAPVWLSISEALRRPLAYPVMLFLRRHGDMLVGRSSRFS